MEAYLKMKETHIVGAVYRKPGTKLVLRCDRAELRGYTWVATESASVCNRRHKDLIKDGWTCEYPKESNFDRLYLRLKN